MVWRGGRLALELHGDGNSRGRVGRGEIAEAPELRDTRRIVVVAEALGQRGERSFAAHPERRGVVDEDQREAGIAVEVLDQVVARIGEAAQEHIVEAVPAIELTPRRRIGQRVGVQVAVRTRAGLVDVHERQPGAIGPETVEQVAAQEELVESTAGDASRAP